MEGGGEWVREERGGGARVWTTQLTKFAYRDGYEGEWNGCHYYHPIKII